MKKLLFAAMLCAFSLNAEAQFDRGDKRSDVVEFLQTYYSSTQYSLYYNNDISFTERGNYYLWKFDSQNRISHLYIWYKSAEDDRSEREDLNSGSYYKADDNKWKKYFSNGNVSEIVTYGNVSTTCSGANTPWVRTGAWHYDYYY